MTDPADDDDVDPQKKGHIRAAKAEFEQQVAHARDQFDLANERIKERTGRDLILAILIGLAIGVTVIASLMFIKEIFVFVAIAVVAVAVWEFARALQTGGRRVDVIPQILGSAAILASAYFATVAAFWMSLFVTIAVTVVWRLVSQMAAADGRVYRDVLSDIVVGSFIPLYVPFLSGLALVLLRVDGGEWWLMTFITIVVVADTGAYASGLIFGKHAMAPKISPNKTWEGFAGAGVCSLIAGGLIFPLVLDLEIWMGLVFAVVMLCTATLGDLAESMLKRDLGIKDMSSWVPGHGGILDRLDSMLPSAFGALLMYQLFLAIGALS